MRQKRFVKIVCIPDHLRRYAYGVDASCYSYLPKVVVKAEDEREVRRLIRLCQQCGTPHLHSVQLALRYLVNVPVKTCFIVCNDGFQKMEVIDDGKALKCECGVIGSDANDLLKPIQPQNRSRSCYACNSISRRYFEQ